MPVVQKSKIKREKMDYKKTLFILCVRIDKAVMEAKVLNFRTLKPIDHGIAFLESKLRPYFKDIKDDDTKSIDYQIGKINKDLNGMKILNLLQAQEYFNKMQEKYALLHMIMNRENLLGEESEESEA